MAEPESPLLSQLRTLDDLKRFVEQVIHDAPAKPQVALGLVSDNAANGIVLLDTQTPPHYWRVTASNTGVLTTTDLGTGRPSV